MEPEYEASEENELGEEIDAQDVVDRVKRLEAQVAALERQNEAHGWVKQPERSWNS